MTLSIIINKWISNNQNKHLCACGCGQYIKILKQHHWERIPKYIRGHGIHGNQIRGGKLNGMYGYKFNKAQRESQGKFHKNKTYEEAYGKKKAKEIKAKLSLAQKIRFQDPKNRLKMRRFKRANGRWQNGISRLPYSYEFPEIAKIIRKRDNYECQICHKTQANNRNKLPVHHINYNKQDDRESNLITLCENCHNKTNGNRDYWYAYFTYIMEKR